MPFYSSVQMKWYMGSSIEMDKIWVIAGLTQEVRESSNLTVLMYLKDKFL